MNASLATKRAGLGCGLVRRTAGARASTGARAQGSARRSVHRQIRRNLRHEVDVTRGQSPSKVVARATADEETPGESRKLLKNAFYVATAFAVPIVGWSEVVTATTGEGLQGALLGAFEGISYVVLLGFVAKSIALKVRTGTGMPAGPFGLIGALEGVAYLEVVGFIVSQVLKATKGV